MHIIRDNFAPEGLVRSLLATWLPVESGHWHCYDNGKLATKDPTRLPVAAGVLLSQMAAVPVHDLLGLPETFADLEYLHGAGLHQISVGGSLGTHLDSERHPLLPWKREASAVLYLDDVDGGELELLTPAGTLIERVAAKRNRLVLFATAGQWHRVTECRSPRRSLCLFFWSLGAGGTATKATFKQ